MKHVIMSVALLLGLVACQPSAPLPVMSGTMSVAADIGPAISTTKTAITAVKGTGSLLSKGAAIACAAQADANLATDAAMEAGKPSLMAWWSKLSGAVGRLCAW